MPRQLVDRQPHGRRKPRGHREQLTHARSLARHPPSSSEARASAPDPSGASLEPDLAGELDEIRAKTAAVWRFAFGAPGEKFKKEPAPPVEAGPKYDVSS